MTGANPLSTDVEPKQLTIAPLKRITADGTVPGAAALATPLTSASTCGWKMTAKTMASTDEAKRTMMAGSFLYIIAPVATGTRRSHGLRSNFDDRAVVNAVVSIDASEGGGILP